ncbi:MAG TPA: SDR family NAD(P)-dependent oxidoreductase [Verrucomicrobiales bacterium]|nr:SDR family NAD(P)-dependent oxidoreductase [Verrucomicrobiales bacterium]
MRTDPEPGEWTGQVALVTGGADGLGLALSRHLLGLGVRVAVLDRDGLRLERARADLGEAVRFYEADVTERAPVQAAVRDLLRAEGRVTILVNCAGITGRTARRSHEVDLEDFDAVWRVNVRGCLVPFQAVIPAMLAGDYGRVLHVASIAGKEGNAGMLAYSVSKAAVIAMAKVQGKEYAETGIRVNAVAPAVIRTAMVEQMPEEQVRYMTERIPMKRCGTLEEFARLAAFIVSPGNSFVTGFTFDLTGGRAVY